MWKDLGAGLNAKGIGVFEKTAVCIDQNGLARVFAPTTASFAYFYQIELVRHNNFDDFAKSVNNDAYLTAYML